MHSQELFFCLYFLICISRIAPEKQLFSRWLAPISTRERQGQRGSEPGGRPTKNPRRRQEARELGAGGSLSSSVALSPAAPHFPGQRRADGESMTVGRRREEARAVEGGLRPTPDDG